jgi:predicted nucleic acid-binding protein
MPVYPVTVAIALRTGRLDAENQIQGFKVPLPDLLIGVTALEFGYGAATSNLRHFHQISGLKVVQL